MYKVCSTSGCPHLVSSGSLCHECRKAKDKRRTRGRNPYTSKAHRLARARVLARDPRCVCPGDGPDGCGRHHGLCGAPSTIADHWPIERIELVEAGLDPNDPQRMRGLCKRCHDSKTARTKPSGFNNRRNLQASTTDKTSADTHRLRHQNKNSIEAKPTTPAAHVERHERRKRPSLLDSIRDSSQQQASQTKTVAKQTEANRQNTHGDTP